MERSSLENGLKIYNRSQRNSTDQNNNADLKNINSGLEYNNLINDTNQNILNETNIDYKQIKDILTRPPENRSIEQINFLMKQLSSLDFFNNIYLDDQSKQSQKLLKHMKIEIYKNNNASNCIIYEEGCPEKKFYVVLRGTVKVVANKQFLIQNKKFIEGNDKTSSLGIHSDEIVRSVSVTNNKEILQEVVLRIVKPGQYFGENELIFNSKRIVSAYVANNNQKVGQNEDDVLIGVFCQNTFNNLIQEFVRKQNPFYQNLSLLQMVPKEGKIKLSYLHQKKQLRMNEIIYKQDSKVDYIYYLEKGNVQLKIQKNKILDKLPHSISQKKQEVQLLCTISEKSFIGDEDLLNLNGNRQYSAVVSSIIAVLFYVDATMIQQEIQEAYGIIKTNSMINDYLLYKQQWRNQFIESAQKIKKQFEGFSSSPQKINQNLVDKKKTQSKNDLLSFATDQIISQKDNINRNNISQIAQRCKTENNNYSQTIDTSTYLNTSITDDITDRQQIKINQNHLKIKKQKFQTLNPYPPQMNKTYTQSYLNDYVSQDIIQKQKPKNNALLQQEWNNQLCKSKIITECDNDDNENITSFNGNSYSQIQDNSRFRRWESIAIQDLQGQSIILGNSISQNNLMQSYSPECYSSTLSPCNQSSVNQNLFKIQLKKMDDNKNESFIQNETPSSTIFPNTKSESSKIYDPFNHCWVKKTYPLKSFQKMKTRINAINGFKQVTKLQKSASQSPKSLGLKTQKLTLEKQSSNQILLNNYSNDNEQYQYNNSSPMNKLSINQDFQFSTILENSSKLERNIPIKQQEGDGYQGSNSYNKQQLDLMSGSINLTPILRLQTSFSQHISDYAIQNKFNGINQNLKNPSVPLLNSSNKDKFNNQKFDSNFRSEYNNNFSKISQQSVDFSNNTGSSKINQKVSDQQQQYVKSNKSQSFHNQQNKLIKNQQQLMRNSQSVEKPQNKINHLNLQCKINNIEKDNQNQLSQLKNNQFRRLRKSSVEKCNNNEELVNQYLNKFIKENCNGNEIYQIESSKLLEKKKLLLKDLLNQIGSPSLNCIDINEDQKNTKYDHLLKGLNKQKKENEKKRANENIFNQTISNGRQSNLMNYSNTINYDMNNNDALTNSIIIDQNSVQQNNKLNSNQKSREQTQNSKIFKNLVNSYIKNKDKDNDLSQQDYRKNNLESALTEINLNFLQPASQNQPIYSNPNYAVQRATGRSYNLFKQKQEMRKKLKSQPLNRSYNNANKSNLQKLDISQLHKTLFVFSKDQVDHQSSQLEFDH